MTPVSAVTLSLVGVAERRGELVEHWAGGRQQRGA